MTRYVRIFEHVEQSSGGLYQVEITGSDPARFTVAIGFIESFGTPVENVPNRDAGRSGIFDWYENPVSQNPLVLSDDEPVEKDFQEATPVTKAPVLEKALEPPKKETVERDLQEATPEIPEETGGSSRMLILPILGLLFIYLLVKLLKSRKSSIQVSDQ